ncbi:MAG: hypothetical protein L3J00_00320 [Thiomicrorhabdus sp.]|nr:hypothetical protein [Thiomicrorhabdus sp.]
MNDVKLNGMRELNFNEIEEVSGGWFIPGALLGGGYAGIRQTYDKFDAILDGREIPDYRPGAILEAAISGAGAG